MACSPEEHCLRGEEGETGWEVHELVWQAVGHGLQAGGARPEGGMVMGGGGEVRVRQAVGHGMQVPGAVREGGGAEDDGAAWAWRALLRQAVGRLPAA